MTAPNDHTSPAGPPNVVFIVGDNVGWGDIGCYGGTAPTPRIDALAAEGQRLAQSAAKYPHIQPGEEFTGYA